MIELRNVSKSFVSNGHRKVVADNLCFTFPRNSAVAILGRNGAGKSTLLKMISGAIQPDSGRVIRSGTLSWPIAFGGSFHGELSGLQNVRFVARVYGVDTDELVEFVRDFAQLGHHFDLPVRTYSSGMRSRLTFGVSMGIRFDTYLSDEVGAVGDASFKVRSERLFNERMSESGAIMVTHSMAQVKRLCQHVLVLENGKLTHFDDVARGVLHFQRLMKRSAESSG